MRCILLVAASRSVLFHENEGHCRLLLTVCWEPGQGLLVDNAKLHVYDPKVTESQIHGDLALRKFEWDHPKTANKKAEMNKNITVFTDAYTACKCGPAAEFINIALLWLVGF